MIFFFACSYPNPATGAVMASLFLINLRNIRDQVKDTTRVAPSHHISQVRRSQRSHTRRHGEVKAYHSLSYQATSLTNLSFKEIPALASKMHEWGFPFKSVETSSSSLYARIPLYGPSAAALTAALIVS